VAFSGELSEPGSKLGEVPWIFGEYNVVEDAEVIERVFFLKVEKPETEKSHIRFKLRSFDDFFFQKVENRKR
jgi:uncharacterized protein with GYD domain